MTQSLLPQNGMWAYSTATITQCRSGTRNFFGNLIIVVWGIRHGRYYLKMGCEHTAWPLSPTVNANLELLWALDNCDARRMTRSLLPQDGMWAYGMTAITHYISRTQNFFRNLITVWCEAYDTIAITSRWDVSIRHNCYHPLQIRNLELLRNLMTVMWGVWHDRYNLKMGCEHMA